MIRRLAPPEPASYPKSSHRSFYLIGGLVGVVMVAFCVGVGYLIVQEQRKYDVVYQRLNIERLPKAIENTPYVQAELAKLMSNPCDGRSVSELANGLETLGEKAWAKVVRTGYVERCVASSATPRGALDTLKGLAVDSVDTDIRQLAVQVMQKATCDRSAVEKLIGSLQRASDNAPATIIGDAFLAQCGHDARIAYFTMQSYNSIGDYARSLSLADAYEKIEPNDPYWPAWRGRNLERLGRTSEAADAYLRSLSLWAQPDNVVLSEFWRAANTLRAANRYCEAIKVLERYVSYDPAKRRTPQITTVITENRALAGGCPG